MPVLTVFEKPGPVILIFAPATPFEPFFTVTLTFWLFPFPFSVVGVAISVSQISGAGFGFGVGGVAGAESGAPVSGGARLRVSRPCRPSR